MTDRAMLPELAEFALGPLEPSDDVWRAGRRTILNAAALAVGAVSHPSVDAACEVVYGLARRPEATIPGRGARVEAEWAAFVGGIAVHAEDYDDTHLATVVHPGAPVVPPALAVAEWLGSTGRELLEAVVVGVEVACRVGLALGPGHFDRGWHLTGTTGRFGAAAAVARLAGLAPATLAGVWARSAVETGGVQAAFGTMTKPYHPGKAAYDGIVAVRDAMAGLLFPPMTAQQERQCLDGLGPDPDIGHLTAELGDRWEITRNTFKPYACGIVSHPVIDAAVQVRERVTGPIDRVTVAVNPVVLDVMGVEEPEIGLESKFSVYHCAAVGLLDGMGGPPQFSDERTVAQDTSDLRRRVVVVTDPSIARDAARLEVDLAVGGRLVARIDHARGSVARPMTDDDLAAKADASMRSVIGDEAGEVIDMILRIESHTARDLATIIGGDPER